MSRRAASDTTRSAVAHLARRAGFGLHADEVDALAELGYEAAVDQLVDGLHAPDAAADAVFRPVFPPAPSGGPPSDPAARRAAAQLQARQRQELVRWWLERMVVADQPLQEKLTFLWHDHFATSLAKVRSARVMAVHHDTLHTLGPDRFDDLLHAMSRDPAMLVWLDGRDNRRGAPNENYARELLELFGLGHGSASGDPAGHGEPDEAGAEPYTEADVAAAARALTGWRIDRESATGVLVAGRHDAGTKTLLGVTGELGLDEVVEVVTSHPACAPHVVSRLWSRMGRPAGPDDPVVRELAAPFAGDLDTTALLRRLFLHPAFLAADTRRALVKTPVEWMIGALRALRLPLPDRADRALAALGQVPFAPPDVAGWPSNRAWLSTASARSRLEVAAAMAAATDPALLGAVAPADRPDAVARLLGVDAWGPATSLALATAADRPDTLLTVALVAPEHLLA